MSVTSIEPNGVIKILENVPLDNGYGDTLTFSNLTEQETYFSKKVFQTVTNATPVRLQNSIRVPIVADKLYNCNYIMFQNSNFSTKWFYAFITQIDFVNINMSEIHYEIDVIQTWYFDMVVKPCYVEREHSNSDNIGDNIVSEAIDLGDYKLTNHSRTEMFDSKGIVMVDSREPNAKMLGGVYNGLHYTYYVANQTGFELLKSDIDTVIKGEDTIVGIAMIPYDFVTSETIQSSIETKSYNITKDLYCNGIDGYIPKNNKLYTYPYNCIFVDNGQGGSAEYRIEFFETDICSFTVGASCNLNSEGMLIPTKYRGSEEDNSDALTIKGFPQCATNTDLFLAWLSQNAVPLVIGAVSGAVTGNPIGIIGSAVGTGTSILNKAITKPTGVSGSPNASTCQYGIYNAFDFHFYNKHITKEYAQIIDDYFTAFGYATQKIKIPNINGRKSWNYVKTQNAKIVGKIPFNHLAKIKEIFNTGITFWHGDFVGDYTQENNIV